MLVRLDLALITEAASRLAAGEAVGSVGKNIEDIESPRIMQQAGLIHASHTLQRQI